MEETQAISDNREFIVGQAQAKNLVLSPDALDLLEKATKIEIEKTLDSLSEQNLFIIKGCDVESKLLRTKIAPAEVEVKSRTAWTPIAKEYSANFRVRSDLQVPQDSICEGTVNDYVQMFQSRFEFLSALLKNRSGFSPRPIGKLGENAAKRDVDFIGMVTDKWVTKKGHLAFRFEDLENQCIALALKDKPEIVEKCQRIALDEVVGLRGSKGFGDLIIIKEVLQPDLPIMPPKTISEPLSVCVISDIHAGSKLFLEKEFKRFLSWINGKVGGESEREAAGKIKYLYICGDNVDGIGVYPNQEKGLLIPTIAGQYEELEELLLQIPEYIEIAMIPGQHDAVRWADPQPAISKKYVPRLHALSNFHLMPSPGWTQMEDMAVVQYHGASLHELYGVVKNLSMTKPELAMVEILKRRSFLTNFGSKQPYAPEKKDYSVMREAPDFYLGGDMHHYGTSQYRGCTVINGACFQSQTDFEVRMGHVPTPGIVAVIDLQNRQVKTKNMTDDTWETMP
ncbi:MAG: metallophosphoesterase [Candidatus Micrarchaeota archaeon]